jgi:hypothetical protein
MFYRRNGTAVVVNCVVIPDSDVSGIGVRGAFYTQAILLIFFSVFCKRELRPGDIVLSNLSIQVTSAALIGAAYLDPFIDVPHTLVTSQFAILFSACRITTYDLCKPFPGDPTKGLKFASQAWLLDLVFRTLLLMFNMCVWLTIRRVQNEPSVCPDGFGDWGFFTFSIDVSKPQAVTTFAFAYCIMDILWEGFRVVADMFRSQLDPVEPTRLDEQMSTQLVLDPRFWAVQQTVRRWNLFMRGGYTWLTYCSGFRKIVILVFIIVSVETTVKLNRLEAENHWTYGQIFQMLSMSYLFSVLGFRYVSSGLGVRHLDWLLTDPHYIWVPGLIGFIFGMCLGGRFIVEANNDVVGAQWLILVFASLLFGWTPFVLVPLILALVYHGGAQLWDIWSRRTFGVWRYPAVVVSVLFLPMKNAFEYALDRREIGNRNSDEELFLRAGSDGNDV